MQTTSEHPSGRSRLSRAPLGGASLSPPPPTFAQLPARPGLGPAPPPFSSASTFRSRGRRAGGLAAGPARDAVGRARGAPRAAGAGAGGRAGSLPRRRPRPRFFPARRPSLGQAQATSSSRNELPERVGNGRERGRERGGNGKGRAGNGLGARRHTAMSRPMIPPPTGAGPVRFALIPHAAGGATSKKGPFRLSTD